MENPFEEWANERELNKIFENRPMTLAEAVDNLSLAFSQVIIEAQDAVIKDLKRKRKQEFITYVIALGLVSGWALYLKKRGGY